MEKYKCRFFSASFLLNVEANCIGSFSIVNVPLKEKSMGAKETKEVYFSGKLLGIFLITIVCHFNNVSVQIHTNIYKNIQKV